MDDLLNDEGPFAQILDGFEPRPEQKSMLKNVSEAYSQDAISLIEAGTGTGKSIAYLLPAILWAKERGERTLISTNTISLQEQLIKKDIPIVLKALGMDLKAVIVKGMRNYLCLRKLDEASAERRLLQESEADELLKIEQWERETTTGSKSELPFNPSGAVWERVCAESDTCTHKKCPHFKQCHFFKARQEAQEAQLLISNHHMLFADLSVREKSQDQKDPGLLPAYRRVIIDEAHNIEEIATEFLASRVSHFELRKLMGRLAADRHGKLTSLYTHLSIHFRGKKSTEAQSIMTRMELDFPSHRNDLLEQIHTLFLIFEELVESLGKENQDKLRLLPHHHTHPIWEALTAATNQATTTLKQYAQAIHSILQDLDHIKEPTFQDKTASLRHEIGALTNRLASSTAVLEGFISEKREETKVRWIEKQQWRDTTNITLVDAELEVAKVLPHILFEPFSSVVLCSATLTTNQSFSFIKKRLGISSENMHVTENIYDSPFNYQSQALLAVPTDIPLPSDPSFTHAACDQIWYALQACQGNAFVLFTSYSMLKTCFDKLAKPLREQKFSPMRQGEEGRHALINRFKESDKAVLFGTDSFWEGVDVAGDDLRCVIIAKLPFQVPTEPMTQARTEAIEESGGSPFFDYAVPHAIVKFKQGFGRLIRNKKDRGCIVCLDSRLFTKKYGQLFLNSLPNCQRLFTDSASLHQKMVDFYR